MEKTQGVKAAELLAALLPALSYVKSEAGRDIPAWLTAVIDGEVDRLSNIISTETARISARQSNHYDDSAR